MDAFSLILASLWLVLAAYWLRNADHLARDARAKGRAEWLGRRSTYIGLAIAAAAFGVFRLVNAAL